MSDSPASTIDLAELPPEEVASRSPLLPLLGSALLYLFLYYLITSTRFMPFLEPWGKSPIMGWAGLFISLVPMMLLQLLLVRYLSAWEGSLAARMGVFLASAAIWGSLILLFSRVGGPPGMFLDLVLGPWTNLSLIAATVLLGAFISLAVKDAPLLLPVLLVGGIVDYWGVYYGTTHQVIKNAPQIVERVSAKVPSVSFGGIYVPPTTIGPGDFLFLGIFFACMYRFGFDVKRTFWMFYVLLLVSLVLVNVFPIPIPALVPMAVAMLAVNWRKLRLSRAELYATAYVLAFLVVLLVGVTVSGVFKR
ncbi:MAG: hypothetical protein KY468_18870 [Armatimonadetes bacterium]|nr:hypothetical protein [Armatimonadota bacterium]